MTYHVLIGIGLAVCSATCSAFGQTLQRKSWLDLQPHHHQEDSDLPPPWTRKLWLLGTGLFWIAGLLDLASLVYAPMAVVVVIYALRLPLVALLAAWLLNVRLLRMTMVGISFCAAGTGLSLIFAPSISTSIIAHPSEFWSSEIWMYVGVSIVACALLTGRVMAVTRRSDGDYRGLDLPLLVAWVMTLEKLFNSAMGRLPTGESCFSMEWVWLPSLVGVLCLLGGVMNLFALEKQSPHLFVPAVFGFLGALMSLQSVLVGEFAGMAPEGLVAWGTGVVASVFGTVVISRSERLAEGEGDAELGQSCSALCHPNPVATNHAGSAPTGSGGCGNASGSYSGSGSSNSSSSDRGVPLREAEAPGSQVQVGVQEAEVPGRKLSTTALELRAQNSSHQERGAAERPEQQPRRLSN